MPTTMRIPFFIISPLHPRETSVFDDERSRPGRIGEPHSFSVRVENLADYTGIRGALSSPLPPFSPGGSTHVAHEFVESSAQTSKLPPRVALYGLQRHSIVLFFITTAHPARRKGCRAARRTQWRARTGAQVRAHEAITCLRCGIIDDKALTLARR